ncbi:MAG: hypothetical protein CVU34_07335 [Betaproteobacteria bacterium HGW-Betaproteobacteria-7]|jgi:mono/diheme cytochrome c family protein|nr:MAG: hypothetical protein CVU34_07335 [Betaproteobacteria bacterium HGW-Betaproteobacteria-7]
MHLRQLLLACLLSVASGLGTTMPAAAEKPTRPPDWVVTPAAPGDNLPPVGRSLFDQLFAVSRQGQATIELPFPFASLLARIDAELARDPASPLPPAKRVLIPLGRSLQRSAAAPDYFSYPRVVVAVDGDPASPNALFLKDRLYIGYQEKSAVLEVISYNEAAGRFEFQLVKDYRAGSRPQVFYANRSLCFACHQNGAPIFSRALWDETNANPQAAALLAATGQPFYGIPVGRGIDIPYAIDIASERANGFALTQKLWREGCGDDDQSARRCRAGLFTAALQLALADGQAWTADVRFDQDVAARLRAEAQRSWPAGLALGNADLPNRNPLQNLPHWPDDERARVAHSDVAARFDPLLPRPPNGIWQAAAPEAMAIVVSGLAEFIATSDRRRLAATLARQPAIATTRLSAPCRIAAQPPASRWSIQCAPAPGEAGPTLAGEMFIRNGRPIGGRLHRLALPGGTALSQLELAAASPSGGGETAFQPRRDGRPLRTAAGHAINRLIWRHQDGDASRGTVVVEIREEFAAIEQALAALVEGPESTSLFAARAIPRQALQAALLRQLSQPAEPPCCAAAAALPPPRLEMPAAIPGSPASLPTTPGLQAFYPYCAVCHQSAETFPPNFLSGSPEQVAARLRHCAPRLYVRLAMADLAPDQRAKTPMPPESMLPAFASDPTHWRASPARQVLLAQVGDWLRAESGQPAQLSQLLTGGYEALRPCLPAP